MSRGHGQQNFDKEYESEGKWCNSAPRENEGNREDLSQRDPKSPRWGWGWGCSAARTVSVPSANRVQQVGKCLCQGVYSAMGGTNTSAWMNPLGIMLRESKEKQRPPKVLYCMVLFVCDFEMMTL